MAACRWAVYEVLSEILGRLPTADEFAPWSDPDSSNRLCECCGSCERSGE
jgi:hypothetical protein